MQTCFCKKFIKEAEINYFRLADILLLYLLISTNRWKKSAHVLTIKIFLCSENVSWAQRRHIFGYACRLRSKFDINFGLHIFSFILRLATFKVFSLVDFITWRLRPIYTTQSSVENLQWMNIDSRACSNRTEPDFCSTKGYSLVGIGKIIWIISSVSKINHDNTSISILVSESSGKTTMTKLRLAPRLKVYWV